ncbi:ABC transporter ATP-binding protein [Pectinatus frisingensis]|uniref:ABC transporter ATP-binding protein n=1 Tax=Pectinatus frisingensis TaxID=865 RepID=UPI0018C7C7DF|nr:ABC transporter ATP-binding protein [Pectinatus frisingensis]
MAELFELRDVKKNYAGNTILNGISLSLLKKHIIAITGDSGVGKTTLLSIMGLLQQPSSGELFANGIAVNKLQLSEQAKLRGKYFGFVFQRARLIGSLSVLENVLVPARFAKTEDDVIKRAKFLLKKFGMSNRLNYKPQELSVGQLRRVSLARALLLRPSIILADEPTNDLDPSLAETVAEYFLQIRNDGMSVVIVTHDYALANRADQVFHLEHGQLSQITHA